MKSFQLALSLPLLASLATAQSILQYGSGDLPDCAKNCQTLNTAQYLCVPPVAPTSSQAIYDNCFCQSNYFKETLAVGSSSEPSNVCNSACPDSSDQLAIQNWYDNLCNSDGSGASTTSSSGSTPSQTSSSGSGGSTAESSGQIWWHEHARWIAMAIVLICAFLILGALGIFLKRMRARKHARAAALAPPVVWGPHQNQHHTGGIAYGAPAAGAAAASREKGKARAGVLPTANMQPVDYSEKDGVKKLKKAFFGRGTR